MRLVFLVSLSSMCLSTLKIEGKSLKESRQSKLLLNLLSIVRFPNTACLATSFTAAGSDIGTCMTNVECRIQQGIASGSCAAGFGVCCVFEFSRCGASVSKNGTYFRNPRFPSAYADPNQTCTLTIRKSASDVCQLKLSFDLFTTQVGPFGLCGGMGDSLKFYTPTAAGPPPICGSNTGSHVYLDAGPEATSEASILIFKTGWSTGNRVWSVKVTHISCNSLSRAPDGCTQFFTGHTGTVKSYNFDGGQMLKEQNHLICIRREIGHCSIMWKESRNVLGSNDIFQLGTSGNCTDSYIQISGKPATCGTLFASTKSSVVPFLLNTYIQGERVVGIGYALDFLQIPC